MSTGELTRRRAVGTSLAFKWFPTVRTAPAETRREVAERLNADPHRVGLSKVLLNPKHPAVRAANDARTVVRNEWVSATLPYVTDGIRLVGRDRVQGLAERLDYLERDVRYAAEALDDARSELIADARERLGSMFSLYDYPSHFAALLRVQFRVLDLEPPTYLADFCAGVYEDQMRQTAESFAQAALVAEQTFASELLDMVAHLRERLEGNEDGTRRIFRDSAIENLRGFFDRFRALNIESGPALVSEVAALESLMTGVTPEALRSNEPLRDRMRADLGMVVEALEPLTTDAPRRRLTRVADDASAPAMVAAAQ